MKTRSLFLPGLLLTASLCLSQLPGPGSPADTDTNAAPAVAAAPPTQSLVDISELQNLREKLDSIQHANEAATGKWSAMAEQNVALSKVLAELQDTLVQQQEALASQRKRESDLTQEARSLNTKVMLGAAAGMFLVFLASYWFQLRCLNRVMEISRNANALGAPMQHPLLEAPMPSMAESKLLEVVRVLENRIQLLEAPAKAAIHNVSSGNGNGNGNGNGRSEVGENGHSGGNGKVIDTAPAEADPAASKASLLMAKGEILLDMERFPEAATSFQEAVNLEPANAEAHLKKGIALERMNRFEQSLGAYEEAIRLNPSRAFAYVYKARVLAALNRHDEALSVYDAALGKNAPKSATTGFASHLHRVKETGI